MKQARMRYEVLYDITQTGLWGAAPPSYWIASAVMVLGGAWAVAHGVRRRQVAPVLVGLLFGGVFATFAVKACLRQLDLLEAARAGRVQVSKAPSPTSAPARPAARGPNPSPSPASASNT